MTRYAVYDMDKTITQRPSWTPWLMYYTRRVHPWRLLLLPLLLVPLCHYALGFIGRAGLKERSQRLLMGRRAPAETIAMVARRFAEDFGSRQERAEALAQIAADKAAGYTLVLATASATFYAGELGRRWGFDIIVGTRNVPDGDRVTPQIAGGNCYGANKLALIVPALLDTPEDVIFYSDSESDLPAFLWARKPVAVTPTGALQRLAGERGWPVRNWR